MIQLLLLLLIFFAVVATGRFLATASADAKRKFRRGLFWFGMFLLVLLAARGYLVWLLPLAGALMAMLIRMLPALVQMLLHYGPHWRRWQQQRAAGQPGAGDKADTSSVRTHYLHMQLDHVTGEIAGEVLTGRYAGRQLRQLNLEQLRDLYAECNRGDPESATLLQAYLERIYGVEWAESQDAGRASLGSGEMTADEAYQVLGLESGASRDDIVGAHRRLMQRLHPDRGGSDYLAAKINRAKDLLLRS